MEASIRPKNDRSRPGIDPLQIMKQEILHRYAAAEAGFKPVGIDYRQETAGIFAWKPDKIRRGGFAAFDFNEMFFIDDEIDFVFF